MAKVALAFDCFGTVFDMTDFDRNLIRDYVNHVQTKPTEVYSFPNAWWEIKAHADSAAGIKKLQEAGFKCFAASNGSRMLIESISVAAGITWDGITDFAKHGFYKPDIKAYTAITSQFSLVAKDVCIVTANRDFGDVEGAKANGMMSQVIRQDQLFPTLEAFADFVIAAGECNFL